jgi:hypothetical protein
MLRGPARHRALTSELGQQPESRTIPEFLLTSAAAESKNVFGPKGRWYRPVEGNMKLLRFGTPGMLIGFAIIVSAVSAQAQRDETRGGTLGTSPAGQEREREAPSGPEDQKVVGPQNTGRSKQQPRERCYTRRRGSDGQMITHCRPPVHVQERQHKESPSREAGGRQGVEAPGGGGRPRGAQSNPRGR